MNKPTLSKVKFKSYEQHQSQPFPSSLDDWIPENDLGRLVSLVIDKMELDSVLNNYPGGGVPSYHPKMRLKVDYLTSQQKYEQHENFLGECIHKASAEDQHKYEY